MVSENGTKVCCKCGKEKPVSEFHKDKNSSDGYTYQCKECRNAKYKEYYHSNIDKMKEKRENTKEYRKEYYSDPERKFQYRKRYIEQEFGIKYVAYDQQDGIQEEGGCLEPVFVDGKLVRDNSLSEIRERINSTLV